MFIDTVKAKADAAARKAGLGAAGAVLGAVGLGFLTVAAWMVLSEWQDALFAATVIGAVYAGLSLILFALARRVGHHDVGHATDARAGHGAHPSHEGERDLPPLAEAFLYGLSAGAAHGGSHPRH